MTTTLSNRGPDTGVLIFTHIPKTAGTTLKFILRNSFCLSHCDSTMTRTPVFGPAELRWASRMFPLLKSIGGHNLTAPVHTLAGTGAHRYVTILRDPVMRVISSYQDYILRGKYRRAAPLGTYLDNPANTNFRNLQCRMLAGVEDADAAIETVTEHFALAGLTERFDETACLLNRITPYRLNLRYHRSIVARNNDVKKRILADPVLIEHIEARNRADRKLYTYVSETLFPGYLRRFPPLAGEVRSADSYTFQNQPRVLLSKWYNKLMFRQTMKLRNRIREGRSCNP